MVQKLIGRLVAVAVEYDVIEKDQGPIVEYGLLAGFYNLAGMAGIVLVGFLLGIPKLAFAGGAAAASFRFVSGGAHFESPILCFIYSVGSVALISLGAYHMGHWLHSAPSSLTLVMLLWLLVIGLRVVSRNVPVDSPKRPIVNNAERKMFKQMSLCFTFCMACFFALSTLLWHNWSLGLTLWFVFFWQLFSLTKVGSKVYKRIEGVF